MLPRWQSAHKGMLVNHWPCSISWHSLGPDAPHTTQSISLIRVMCSRSEAVGAFLFFDCILLADVKAGLQPKLSLRPQLLDLLNGGD